MNQGFIVEKVMKIRDASGRTNAIGGASGISPAAKAGRPSETSAAAAPAAPDGVQLSNLARLAAAYHDSPIDEANHVAKLSSLSDTVSSGAYQVEAGALSNGIIEASMRLSGGNYF
jgi:hypothetical protein